MLSQITRTDQLIPDSVYDQIRDVIQTHLHDEDSVEQEDMYTLCIFCSLCADYFSFFFLLVMRTMNLRMLFGLQLLEASFSSKVVAANRQDV
jgi:hypothetical protein